MGLIFCIIFFGLFFGIWVKYDNMKEAREEINEMNERIEFAASSAIKTLKNEYGSDDVFTLTYEEFFRAYELHANDDVSDLYLFVPAMVYCDTKGYYVGSLDPDTLIFEWTDLQPYMIENENFRLTFGLDDTFTISSGIYDAYCERESFFAEDEHELRDYEKKENSVANGIFHAYSYEFTKDNFYRLKSDAIIGSLQKTVGEYINSHNQITRDMGLKYIYTAPSFYSINQEYPSFIVCFQGYPLKANGRVYNNLYVRSGYIDRQVD